MRKFKAFCFKVSAKKQKSPPKQKICKDNMESSTENSAHMVDEEVDVEVEVEVEKLKSKSDANGNNLCQNVVLNQDFSQGLGLWHTNSCNAVIVSPNSSDAGGLSTCLGDGMSNLGENYALVTNRKQCWHSLEQDISSRVAPGSTYKVFASVGVSGQDGSYDVLATLKFNSEGSDPQYMQIGRIQVSRDKWETLEGTFTLPSRPDHAVFYLEGPPPGVDLLIRSVVISNPVSSTCIDAYRGISSLLKDSIDNNLFVIQEVDKNTRDARSYSAENIIVNHCFSEGLLSWNPNHCDAFTVSPDSYVAVKDRKESWQGLELDITGKVIPGHEYKVEACVSITGCDGSSDVQATLKLEYEGSETKFLSIERIPVSKGKWMDLEGTFSLSLMPNRVVFYLEGPPPGVDFLIKSVVISSSSSTNICTDGDENVIVNPNFEDGLNNWSGRGCKVVLHDSMADGKIVPQSGKAFAAATERKQTWNGIQQDITGRVQRKLAYEVTALVSIYGNNVTSADLRATLWVKTPDGREQYIGISSVQATDKDWTQLQGKFLINGSPSNVVIYLEGPPAGTDILLNSFVVKHAQKTPPSPPPFIENAAYGVNIIQNSELSDGTNSWFPLGNCTLAIGTGSPHILPPMARDSLGPHEPLSGRYILVTNRTQNWMGPAQLITDHLELFLTYQVSAWVKVGSVTAGPQNVNIALSVDGQWVNGGQVEIGDDRWHEVGGSFRIEKKPSKVMVYIQGPAPGVDLMLAGPQIFAVDRHARFKYLRKQTDMLRKRDVVVKFTGSSEDPAFGCFVKVRQLQNSFPFGSCINRTNIDNEDFVAFFLKNFNWAVFGNELKWYWTEAQQGNFNYRDADEMLDLCQKNNIQCRGHCIFWEVDGNVQQWIKNLNKNDLMTAVQSRLTGLLTRYKGKFRHYDVNNEMLHGSFYQDHIGKDIRANMFKTANKLDPSALLFVNDYHVEDGCDTRSSPEKYIQQVLDLQEQGAPVGGIGIQGHIDTPVGPVVCSALDKLGILGQPIWFTELDVSSINDHVRADDLEVMLREAFAHPAVEGVMLWGFWELFMSRDNSHLVNAEGDVNEAGKRYLQLKQEWLTRTHGEIDEQGQFSFRGYHGTYEVEVETFDRTITKTFEVEKGDSPLVISLD